MSTSTLQQAPTPATQAQRRVVHRTLGRGHGPITRLMSPGDLGQYLKPFVFLDIFDMDRRGPPGPRMPIHPHSGIATVTVLTQGALNFEDPDAGTGTLGYGGVEWMRASAGVWHGQETSPADVPRIQGFQLWVALPPELENAQPQSRYIEARDMRRAGPAHVIVGEYEGVRSPVPAWDGLNYLLVTLRAGEAWTYQPPAGHTVGWLAMASGTLDAGTALTGGEMAVFEPGEQPIALANSGDEDAVFVLGSAVPHAHELHLGNYSVHTSAQALAAGERRIGELYEKMQAAGDRRTASGAIPVYR
ncbi:pirin family protein [Caenimonas aquaedulcis]|uniref:Pirin family protein n=1 Tax=Caenimonas aquaedulcis TaxID=2793270 RepID=A0A931H8D8_9BURK|nr:pirin family protein [Caenimonas aquaedulcis]MBG9390609.1 pirin family protein [Caenimonas aquaedulcis]